MSEVESKKVTLHELFFDLVFVYAISRTTKLAEGLQDGRLPLADYGNFTICFWVVITVWLYQSGYVNRFGTDNWRDRLFLFINMTLLLFLSNAISEDWQAIFVPFNLSVGLLISSITLQYICQWFRKPDRRVALLAWLRGFVALMYFVSLAFPYYIGAWIAIGSMIASWCVTMIVGDHQTKVNLPHLVERFGLITIITFGEMIIDTAPYFNVQQPDIYAFLIFAIVASLFVFYSTEFDRLLNHHRQSNGLLVSYSHYIILLALSSITLALAFLHEEEVNLSFASLMLYGALAGFYASVLLNALYNKPQYQLHCVDLTILVLLWAAGAAVSLILAKVDAVIWTTAVCSMLIAGYFNGFYRIRQKWAETNRNSFQ